MNAWGNILWVLNMIQTQSSQFVCDYLEDFQALYNYRILASLKTLHRAHQPSKSQSQKPLMSNLVETMILFPTVLVASNISFVGGDHRQLVVVNTLSNYPPPHDLWSNMDTTQCHNQDWDGNERLCDKYTVSWLIASEVFTNMPKMREE